jgi:hypothetical protein
MIAGQLERDEHPTRGQARMALTAIATVATLCCGPCTLPRTGAERAERVRARDDGQDEVGSVMSTIPPFTVRSPMPSEVAICLFSIRSAMRRSTACSRSLRNPRGQAPPLAVAWSGPVPAGGSRAGRASAFMRAAANSIASGMPSNRHATCATACALSGVTRNPDLTRVARSHKEAHGLVLGEILWSREMARRGMAYASGPRHGPEPFPARGENAHLGRCTEKRRTKFAHASRKMLAVP